MSKQSQQDIQEAKEKAILNAPSLYFYKLIAQSIGRNEDTLNRWRNEDPEFADNLDQARNAFIRAQMGKARPEFLLERTERELFSPPKQEVEHSGEVNPIRVLLEAYGITEGGNDTKIDGPVQEPPQSQT